MGEVTIKLNGIERRVPEGITILEAARLFQVEIPTLCYLKDINEIGACRMCVVEVKGARSLVASCVYPVNDGMEVWTNTPTVMDSRKKTLQLLLSNHRKDCLSCVRSGNCELMKLCRELGVDDTEKYAGEMTPSEPDESAPHMIRDNSKCVLCRRCTAVCEKVQHIGVIGVNGTGKSTFLKIIAGLEEADAGQVVKGKGVTVAYLEQKAQFPEKDTILGYVLRGKQHSSEAEAKTILTKLGITEFDKDIHTLSGGQKQRVALAKTLVEPAEVLILADQPFG